MNTRKQVAFIGAVSAGLGMGISLSTMIQALATPQRHPARHLSEADLARIEAARLKMERKAAKKQAQKAK